MKDKLIHINYAFLQVDANRKIIHFEFDKAEDYESVTTEINGTRFKWTDKNHCDPATKRLIYQGNLDQCLTYLQSFQIKARTDLNEIYYEETTKYEVA